MEDDFEYLPPYKQFQFSRRQRVLNIARRLSLRVWGLDCGSYRVRLSRTQSRRVSDVYMQLPPALHEICPWNSFVDKRLRIISQRRNEEIIHICKEFENPTWKQNETIEHFVSMLDIIQDTKRDAVVDALIRLYPRLSREIRNQIDLDVDIVARVQSGRVLEAKKQFSQMAAFKKLQLRGTSDIAAAAAYTHLVNFIHILDDYPGTDYECTRLQPYLYRPLYGSS
jgi:hypothetical protein